MKELIRILTHPFRRVYWFFYYWFTPYYDLITDGNLIKRTIAEAWDASYLHNSKNSNDPNLKK